MAGFERWAWLLLIVLGGLGIIVGGTTIDRAIQAGDPSSANVVTVASIAVGVAMLFVVAWGLGARRSWGRPAAVLLLWVLIGIAILRVAFALIGAGSLTIPVEGILAALVLATLPRGQRRSIGQGADRSLAQIYAGIYALSALLPLAIR
jgi:hypothetical protein